MEIGAQVKLLQQRLAALEKRFETEHNVTLGGVQKPFLATRVVQDTSHRFVTDSDLTDIANANRVDGGIPDDSYGGEVDSTFGSPFDINVGDSIIED